MTESLYEILGANKADDADTIKAHYRRRSKECHPDRHPDRAGEFKAITEAFEVLADPAKRAAYDKTGQVPPRENDPRATALSVLSQCVHKILSSDLQAGRKTKERNLIKDVQALLQASIEQLEQKLAEAKKSRQAIADVADRIMAKPGIDNVLATIARAPLRELDAAIAKGECELAAHKLAWDISKDFTFRNEKRRADTSSSGWATFKVSGL